MVLSGNTDRETANAMMRQVLDSNPGIVSTWTIWEPNGFDGRDAEYANTHAHDATGRFVPYWIQDGKGGHSTAAIVDYDKENYYLLPKRTGKIAMQEPYVYNYGGREILQTAVTVPIIVNGKFLGVAGVSVPLTSLQKMVEDISIYETGYASLISNQGIYVGNDEASVLGKRLDQTGRFDAALGQEVLHAIQNSQPRTKRWRGAGGRSRHRNGPGHTAECSTGGGNGRLRTQPAAAGSGAGRYCGHLQVLITDTSDSACRKALQYMLQGFFCDRLLVAGAAQRVNA